MASGLQVRKVIQLMTEAVERSRLDLRDAVVLTEAATGPYAVTPVIAALAGARVLAFTRATRHGSITDVTAQTMGLASQAGVEGAIRILDDRAGLPDAAATADIVTNSGHLRPLDQGLIARMRPGSVIALMFEAWEFRGGDVDLDACRRQGVAVVAVNESHPVVGVFPFLGPLAVRQLQDAGVAVLGNRVAVVCDNPFAPHLVEGLRRAGADCTLYGDLGTLDAGAWDAVVVSLTPAAHARVGEADCRLLAERAPGAAVTQFFGDVDRGAARAAGIEVWPAAAPAPGHMGILLSALGPEPIIRLQSGGIAAAAQVLRNDVHSMPGLAEVLP